MNTPFLKNNKFPFLHIILLCFLVSLITFSLTTFWNSKQLTKETSSQISSPSCKYDIKRLSGLKYIKPIMFVDDECESDNLAGIKQRISDIINRYKTNEGVTSASVYLREYENDDWTCINEDEKYKPGSLFKVPVLITILKMNEESPGFLDKIIFYNKPFNIEKNVAYNDKSIKIGQKYSVKELLNYMITYSDNNATALLETNMKVQIFKKLFTDIGLETPDIYAKEYLVSVNQYSFFMRAIFNAAYLSIDDSEYAAELLTKCDFKDGIVKGLPAGTIVAHKFGESGDLSEKQLHESAFVYLKGKTYLITVMTKGKENKKLAQLISEISQAVYLNFQNNSNNVL